MDEYLSLILNSFQEHDHNNVFEIYNNSIPDELYDMSNQDIDYFLGCTTKELNSNAKNILFYSFFVLIKSKADRTTQGIVKIELINSNYREIEVHGVGLNRKSILSTHIYVKGMIRILYFLIQKKLAYLIRAQVKKENLISSKFVTSIGFNFLREDTEFKYYFLNTENLINCANKFSCCSDRI